MSNRYDADHPARTGRQRDQGRRDDRYGQGGRRDDDESYADYRAGGEDERRWGDGPFPYYRSDNRYPEQRPEYRNPEYRNPEQRSSEYRWDPRNADFRNAEQRAPYRSEYRPEYRPEEHRSIGSSYSRDYWEGDRGYGAQMPTRGVHQGSPWSRDAHTGSIYGLGHGPDAHWPASGAGSDAYHRPVRWRSELDPRQQESSYRTRGQEGRGQAGKGPKGYVRSDDRIREDVCDRLSDDDELDASEITVTVVGGEVRLEGTVVDRYSKHRAEDLAEDVSGVRDVTNNLRTRKGFLQELGDKISGDDKAEHRGHSGAGPHNSPSATGAGAPRGGGFSANR